MAELEVKLAEAEDKIAKYEVELAELKSFREEKKWLNVNKSLRTHYQLLKR